DRDHHILGAHTVQIGDRFAKARIAIRRAVTERRLGEARCLRQRGQRQIGADALGEIVTRCRAHQGDDVVAGELSHGMLLALGGTSIFSSLSPLARHPGEGQDPRCRYSPMVAGHAAVVVPDRAPAFAGATGWREDSILEVLATPASVTITVTDS